MSTTFYCPEAPRLTGDVPCRMSPCSPEDRCGYCKDGVETLNEPEARESEYNMGSGNAARVLETIGLWKPDEGPPSGTLAREEIPKVMQRILVVTNTVKDTDLVGRLHRLQALLSYAHANDYIVNWG